MPQIVQELVSQSLSLVRSRHQAGNVEKFNRYGSPPVDTGTVIGFAVMRDIVACAGARDLEIAYGSLWVNSGESGTVSED